MPRAFRSFICHTCRQRLLPSVTTRAFSHTPKPAAGDDFPTSPSSRTPRNEYGQDKPRVSYSPSIDELLDGDSQSLVNANFANQLAGEIDNQPYKLHVYATKHNTHITFVQPARPAGQTPSSGVSGISRSARDLNKQIDVLLSLSAGNIGFRKGGRGSFDAAYQLAAFALRQMQEKAMTRDMQSLHVVMRGFGPGREAVTKALLGTEGRFIRQRITSVTDATRLKHGGTRSKKPRRLG